MLTLNNLKSPKGAHKNIKRIGRGQGSGQGTQAGKGHKGQKARKSGHVRSGFEGNNLPLYMRIPKKGFSNDPFKVTYAVVSLSDINTKFDAEVVSRETLVEKGLLKGINKNKPIKVLANGEINKSLTFVNIEKFTKTAAEAIAKAGGKIESK